MRKGGVAALLLLAAAACRPAEPVDVTGTVRNGRTGIAVPRAVVTGPPDMTVLADEQGRFSLTLRPGEEHTLRAAADPLCAGRAQFDVEAGQKVDVVIELFPRLEIEESYAQVGFDRVLRIEARTRCDEDANLEWEQVAGQPLHAERLRIEDGGRLVVVRTHALADMTTLADKPGVVPLSRRERAQYRLALSARLGGREERREVWITASATSPGTHRLATGADTYLNGGRGEHHRWTLAAKPDGSEAELHRPDSRTPSFRPDRSGSYTVEHQPSGQRLLLVASTYAEAADRGCDHVGCHSREASAWGRTTHATTFRRGLSGELGEDFAPRCWSCHATGVDPGVRNGGLHELAATLGFREATVPVWEDVPEPIRERGAVWCSACHGPGLTALRSHSQRRRHASAEEQALRMLPYGAGVCAPCHDSRDDPDAHHSSWQQREWSTSAKAQSTIDRSVVRRECASCHTAQGFVAWIARSTRVSVRYATASRVTCAACHDPHGAGLPKDLRLFDVQEVAGKPAEALGAGAVCVACHRSGVVLADDPSAAPHAPQADVLLGRGSRVLRGRALPGAHSALEGSCVSCHMAEPPEEDRGRVGGHTLSATVLGASAGRRIIGVSACSECHGTGVPPQAIGGIRDWDGDGRADNVGQEFDRALARATGLLGERISLARVVDECASPHLAADFVERGGRLVLRSAQGTLLGDCDEDATIGRRERAVGVERLSRDLRKPVWDLAMLSADGSRGRHNPRFAFTLLRRIERASRGPRPGRRSGAQLRRGSTEDRLQP